MLGWGAQTRSLRRLNLCKLHHWKLRSFTELQLPGLQLPELWLAEMQLLELQPVGARAHVRVCVMNTLANGMPPKVLEKNGVSLDTCATMTAAVLLLASTGAETRMPSILRNWLIRARAT